MEVLEAGLRACELLLFSVYVRIPTQACRVPDLDCTRSWDLMSLTKTRE